MKAVSGPSDTQEEANLLARLRDPQSRELAYADLVRQFQQVLYWHVRKMVGNHQDADDILQNTFVKAWKAMDNFRGESRLKTWLYRIATNECLTFLEKQKRRSFTDVEDLANQVAYSQKEGPGYSGDEIQQKLAAALDTLPPKQKLVFHMKYYDEMKYNEIAEVLGGTVGSLKASFHHAVRKIEEILTSS